MRARASAVAGVVYSRLFSAEVDAANTFDEVFRSGAVAEDKEDATVSAGVDEGHAHGVFGHELGDCFFVFGDFVFGTLG